MAKDQFSFDIVSEVDLQEVANAVDQAGRELATRFDFKGTDTEISRDNTTIELRSSTEDRLKAALQVLKEKAVKRHIPLKALSEGEIHPAAKGHVRQAITVLTGISDEKTKEISKFVKAAGPEDPDADPGRAGPGARARARTTCSGHRGREGARFRPRAAVHELPSLAGRRIGSLPRHARRIACATAAGYPCPTQEVIRVADLERLKARAAEIAEKETKILLDRTPGSKRCYERAVKSLPARRGLELPGRRPLPGLPRAGPGLPRLGRRRHRVHRLPRRLRRQRRRPRPSRRSSRRIRRPRPTRSTSPSPPRTRSRSPRRSASGSSSSRCGS